MPAPKLELRQSQSLVMTQQLQQSIKLLQLSSLELTEYIEEVLEQNPLLLKEEERERDRYRRKTVAERTIDDGRAKGDGQEGEMLGIHLGVGTDPLA